MRLNALPKKWDTVVYIGRFQPIHNAHVETLRRAAHLAHKVIVIVGSADKPRTFKNPWTAKERIAMIRAVLVNNVPDCAQFVIESNTDTMYNNNAWAARIQSIVSRHTQPKEKIAIIGHKKDDATGEYLDMFPQWEFESVELIEPLNATEVRDIYFRGANLNFLRGVIPETALAMMENFRHNEAYKQIVREREFVEKYKEQYASYPYPPVFVTTDAVVFCSGHLLMIKRRSEPGKGLWALPGGFLNANTDKSVRDAMLRELREETGIKVPTPVLNGSVTETHVFDCIERSSRGRTITHAFKIELADGALPKVKGADDAEKARWIPIADIRSEECFEDHYDIIQHFLGS